MDRRTRRRKKENKKKKMIILSVLAGILLLIFSFGIFGFITVNKMLNKIEVDPIDKDDASVGITEDTKKKIEEHEFSDKITNIALFGLDKRDKNERGRSDAIMILTIDEERNKLKLTSIMRDSYVDISGHGKDKINHAYAFGGPQLAIKTINENFGLNIKDYVAIDFSGLESIVDSLGGITLEIKDYELKEVNGHIADLAMLQDKPAKYIKGAGKQNLNGMQVVAYTRSRHSGNGDVERTERQRKVLSVIFDRVKSAGVMKLPGIVDDFLPYVKTSMKPGDMIGIGKNVLGSGIGNLEQQRFPIDAVAKGQTINGVWYFVFDKEATKNHIFKYIFDDQLPTAK
jgi:LCP family protein required for cell wall assembly